MKPNIKPLGGKSYGSIAHLPGSRMGPADHKIHEGQDRICTVKARDRHDLIIVQEKLDGSNVGVARINSEILALSRAGYLASTSPFPQHHRFAEWVEANRDRFLGLLHDGERVCGEWMIQAHGTRYSLPHEPFVAFDIMRGKHRLPYREFVGRVDIDFVKPALLHIGGALSIEDALTMLGTHGFHGALDPVEGAVWRVERESRVDFLAKYVRPDKVDGCYLETENGGVTVWNECPAIGGGR